MRIVVVGAGPAGLYFAGLLKQADTRHEVLVLERGAERQPSGYGVVFSQCALEQLRERDPNTAEMIRAAATTWTRLRCQTDRGQSYLTTQPYYAVARSVVLAYLTKVCEQHGVTIRYGEEVSALQQLDEADLIVGADGGRSWVRSQNEDTFSPRFVIGANRFAWFRMMHPAEEFLFRFVATDVGLWCAHIYPDSPETATCIFECTASTFHRSVVSQGNVATSEAYLRQLFASEIGAVKMQGGWNRWQQFSQVSNRCWHDHRTVLLGDAAHTTHFSIGSGTRLALQGAECLSRSLSQGKDLISSLADYQRQRQDSVCRAQLAAQASMAWFEAMDSYRDMEPDALGKQLFSRTGRPPFTLGTQHVASGA